MINRDNIVHIGEGKDTLSVVPNPPKYLSKEAKRHYLLMGKILVKIDRLKETYINALEIYSEAMAQFEFATIEINKKNRKELGTGYIQTFKTGASNISTEIVLRNNAEKTLMQCFKQFGMDPKSDKELKSVVESGQYDIFDQFLKSK